MLVSGKYKATDCCACNGSGSITYDANGNFVCKGQKRAMDGDVDEWCDWQDCDECEGLGVNVVIFA